MRFRIAKMSNARWQDPRRLFNNAFFELLAMKTFDVKLGPEFMFICLYKYLDIIYQYFLLMMVLMYV